MRAVIICLAEPVRTKKRQCDSSMADRIIREELAVAAIEAQAIAIAGRLMKSGKLEPLLICPANSRLAEKARKEELPLLELLTGANPLDALRLWTWQRQETALMALALDKKALKCANALRKMRKSKSTMINGAFFTGAIMPDKATIKNLASAAHCFYGSSQIQKKAEEESEKLKTTLPEGHVLKPGVNLDCFQAQATGWTPARHFIFGIGESLLPKSGALTVVRAMAGLWQMASLPPWEIRMFGKGSRFDEILEEAKSLGVNARLSILGPQPLPEIASGCDAWLVMGTSLGEDPLTTYSGIAAGLPTICAKTPLHEERLGNSGSVLPVECGNPQDLAKQMIRLMQESDTRQKLSRAALEARSNISLAHMAEQACAMLEKWTQDNLPEV